MTKISVIVPIYNVEAYVSDCLDSLAGQTYADFEVLCVIDGSTDGSLDIVRRYAQNDRRFVVLEKENGGLSSARNYGIAHATGQIVAFVDADDSVEPRFCGCIVDAMEQTGAEALVFGATVMPQEALTPWYERALMPPRAVFAHLCPGLAFESYATPFVWRNAVRNDFLNRTGLLFDESLPFGEDVVFQFALYARARSVAVIPDQLYRYRVGRSGSLMDSRIEDKKRLESHVQMLEVILSDWKDLGLTEEWSEELFEWSKDYLLFGSENLPDGERVAHQKRVVELWSSYFDQAGLAPVSVEQKCLCRGEGKLYVLCHLQAVMPFSTLSVEARVGNTCVPASAYPVEGDASSAVQSWVLELPVMAASSLKVRVIPDMRLFEQATFDFEYRKAKWASRANYRLFPGWCQLIRDYERHFTYGHYQVQMLKRYRLGQKAVWRFAVKWAGFSQVRPEISVLDAWGLPFEVPYDFCEFQPAQRDDLDDESTLYLSVTLPSACDHFLITARAAHMESGYAVMTSDQASLFAARADEEMKSAADDDGAYRMWLARHEVELADALPVSPGPSFSVLVFSDDASSDDLAKTLDSLYRQTYGAWEAFAAAGADVALAAGDSARVRFVKGDAGGFLEAAIRQASGDYVAFMCAGDVLDARGLQEYARATRQYDRYQAYCLPGRQSPLPSQAEVLFCDEDVIDAQGNASRPFFKSRLNLDMHYTRNWVGNFCAIKREVLAQMPACEAASAHALLYELTLRALEARAVFAYVPRVLFHAARSPLDIDASQIKGVLKRHLQRREIEARVEEGSIGQTLRVNYQLPNLHPLVSIIIPSKDHIDLLDACIRSIDRKSTYDAYEIIVVENNSVELRTFKYYERLQEELPNVRVVRWPDEFNYSKIVNYGARHAAGEYLLFLNNDTEVISGAFIEQMAGLLQREEVAVVGAKLLFADELVQHAGVGVGIWNAVIHYNQNRAVCDGGYLSRACLTGNYAAVTGACQMVRAEVFQRLGGYDELFAVGFNDVDFCMRALEEGFLVSYTPYAVLNHYEFASRGREQADGEKLRRWERERDAFQQRWPQPFMTCDPYTSPNLLHDNTYFRLDDSEGPRADKGILSRVSNVIARVSGRA